jgi:hypothetical protein
MMLKQDVKMMGIKQVWWLSTCKTSLGSCSSPQYAGFAHELYPSVSSIPPQTLLLMRTNPSFPMHCPSVRMKMSA